MAIHNELGKQGEEIAVDFLLKKGYKIQERNWRYLKAEIDIIAVYNNTLIIVEVKTRSTKDFGDPQDFIKRKQIQLLVTAANEYVIRNDLEMEVRFDAIAVVIPKKGPIEITHLEDGFLHF